MEPYIGQIQIFAFNYPPYQWAFCDGQILSIAQNSVLFSLMGTTFGGNGQTTFALPDLRGRSAVHPGQGPGLSSITWGEVAGVEKVTLLTSNLPAHTHGLRVSTAEANTEAATNAYFANGISTGSGPNKSVLKAFTTTGTSLVNLAPQTVEPSGQHTPVENRSPYLGIYHSISLYGVFPSRN